MGKERGRSRVLSPFRGHFLIFKAWRGRKESVSACLLGTLATMAVRARPSAMRRRPNLLPLKNKTNKPATPNSSCKAKTVGDAYFALRSPDFVRLLKDILQKQAGSTHARKCLPLNTVRVFGVQGIFLSDKY